MTRLTAATCLCAGALLAAIPSSTSAGLPHRPDVVITGDQARIAAAKLSLITVRGGRFYTPKHEAVYVYRSTKYPYSRSVLQAYANALGALWHRDELGLVTVYVLTFKQMSDVCGPNAGACYMSYGDLIVVPGPTAKTYADVLAHEYGHHVANYRDNDPWPGIGWGPKRWATYENVCRLVARHKAYPGDEADHYAQNPGEGFAAAYAYANRRGWNSLFGMWFPDKRARALIKQDTLDPWTHDTTQTYNRSLKQGTTTRVTIKAPLDGELHARVSGPDGSVVRLDLYAGAKLVKTATGKHGQQSVTYTICGTREFAVKITAVSKGGTFTLVATKP